MYVIQRGNNRDPCFLAEEDYRCYLEDLQKAAEKYVCRIHAYVLVTNHVAAPALSLTASSTIAPALFYLARPWARASHDT